MFLHHIRVACLPSNRLCIWLRLYVRMFRDHELCHIPNLHRSNRHRSGSVCVDTVCQSHAPRLCCLVILPVAFIFAAVFPALNTFAFSALSLSDRQVSIGQHKLLRCRVHKVLALLDRCAEEFLLCRNGTALVFLRCLE